LGVYISLPVSPTRFDYFGVVGNMGAAWIGRKGYGHEFLPLTAGESEARRVARLLSVAGRPAQEHDAERDVDDDGNLAND